MSVLVIGRNDRPLMPTTERKARILLQQKKAEVFCRHPFTIRLLYKTGCATQEGCIGIDTGSQNIGVAVTCGSRVVLKAEHKLRSSMEKRKLMETRKDYRRGRRYRKVRYRHPKWRHHTKRVYFEEADKKGRHWRKVKISYQSSRPKGWLPPSLQSKCDHHIRIIQRYLAFLPESIAKNLVIEVARFDMARMNDPTIHGEMYQRGPMYDEENVNAYVFARDEYKCQCCKAKAGTRRADGSIVKIRAHHVLYRCEGATNNPKYMATVCNACHTPLAHKPGGILHKWKEEKKEFTRGLRDATFMNILRKRLFYAFPSASFTYGNITAVDRKRLLLEKSHANDAVAISLFKKDIEHIEDHCKTTFYRQVRKTNRALHEANPRKGRKEPNRTAKRNERNVRERQGFRLWDSVLVDGKIGYISGFSGSSAYIVDFDGEYYEHSGKKQNGKTYKLWTLSKVKRLHPNGGWITK